MTHRKLYLGPLTDNRRWDRLALRPDDVIVATPPKCGTTWMQTIVALLISGDPEVKPDLATRMPWIDIRFRDIAEVADRLDAMTHRRSMKSHTPLDGLPVDAGPHFICVFRHPLDAHLSFCKHVANIPISFFDHLFPERDIEGTAFRWFLEGGPEGFDGDAAPLAHILRHYAAAKGMAGRSKVALFHYADMKRDLAGTFARVAALLDISHPPHVMAQLVDAASFDHMKRYADRFAPGGGTGFYKSDTAFFHSGTTGQWREVLTEAQVAAYDAVMDAQLSAEDRAWLENGSGATAPD